MPDNGCGIVSDDDDSILSLETLNLHLHWIFL